MGKARRLPSERQAEQPSEQRPEQDDVEIIQEKATLAVVAGLGKLSSLLGEQAVKCMLRRRDEETKKWEFQETFPVEDFSFEYVRDVFGGGEYQIQALDESGDFVKSFTFHIDHRYKGKRWSEGHSSTVAGVGDGAPSWLAASLDKMSEAIKVMAERKPEPPVAPPAPPNPMEMIKAIGEAMKALTPAPLPAPPAPPGLAEQLALVESVVNVGTKIIDARGGGEGGSGDMYMGAVEKLAEPITELVKLRVQQEADRRTLNPPGARKTLPPPRRNAVTPPAAGTAAATGGQPMLGVPAWLQEIQRWVPMIVKRARANRSAEDTAFFILDELSEPTLVELAKIAVMPDFGAQVSRVLPAELNNYPEWSVEFLAAIQDWLFSGDDEGSTASDESDEPDAGGDSEPEEEVEVIEEEESKVFDLDAEAKRRMALLEDAPPKEPVPTG